MLLRSRGNGSRGNGRGRGKAGLLSRAGGGLVRLLGGSPRGKSRGKSGGSMSRSAASSIPGWIALGVAFVCFGGGYVVRGYIDPPSDESGVAGLKAGPRVPGLIEADTEPLSSKAFFVAAYIDMPAVEAKNRAIELSRYLQGQGLLKAKPYEYPGRDGLVWVVVVYFDGDRQEEDTKNQLLMLGADVPDPIFVGLRNTESGWPNWYSIR